MNFRYILYAIISGLLFKQVEVFFIRIMSGWTQYWHPLRWVEYGTISLLLFIFFYFILRPLNIKASKHFRCRMALFFTFILLLWLSLSANFDTSFVYNYEIKRSADWIIKFIINLGIYSLPLSLISAVIYIRESVKDKAGSLSPIKHKFPVVTAGLIILIFIESILFTYFVP